MPNAFGGLAWSPDGSRFYVAGGVDDNVHTYTLSNGSWAEVGSPVSLGHKGGLMNLETFVGPTAADVGITADGSTVVVANYETDSVTAVDVIHGVVLAEYDRPISLLLGKRAVGASGLEWPWMHRTADVEFTVSLVELKRAFRRLSARLSDESELGRDFVIFNAYDNNLEIVRARHQKAYLPPSFSRDERAYPFPSSGALRESCGCIVRRRFALLPQLEC